MMNLRNNCLGFAALDEKQVQAIYDGSEAMSHQTLLRTLGRVCISHERLRAELAGSENVIADLETKLTITATPAGEGE